MKYYILFLLIGVVYCDIESETGLKPEYEVITIGMGTTGSTIFGRLVQAGASPVLGVEAGADWTFETRSKLKTQWGSYNYFVDPDTNRGGYIGLFQAGRGAGGSMYVTNNGWEEGHKYWWDNLNSIVQDPRYTYDNAQCFFNNIINKEYQSSSGRIQIRQSNSATILGNNWRSVGSNLGLNTLTDCNNYTTDTNVFCFEPSSTRWAAGNGQAVGSRDSSWAEYVRPILNKTRSDVLLGAKVTKILFTCENCGDREAYGIEVIVNGTYYRINAKYAIILSSGALNTPELLQVSGVGDATALKALGIKVVKDLPAVGNNLQDGGYVSLSFSTNIPPSHFAAGSTSVTSTKPTAFLSSPYAVPGSPDLLLITITIPSGAGSTLLVIDFNLGSLSRGNLYLRTKDPLTATSGIFSYIQSTTDLNRFVSFYNITRAVMANLAATGGYTITETGPSAGVFSQAGLEALVKSIPENGGISNTNHWAGTVAMGPNSDGYYGTAVNPNMQVYGVKHLYVADASVFPYYPGDGGVAPSIFIGEILSQYLSKKYYGNSLKYVYSDCV